MLEARKTVQGFLLQAGKAGSEERIARTGAPTAEFRKRQFRESRGFGQVFGVTFEIDGQLLAGVNAVVRIGHNFLPEFRGAGVLAAALGHQRQVAARLGAKFRGQTNLQRVRTGGMCAIRIAPALEKTREAEEIEAFEASCGARRFGKQCVDFAEKSGEAAQVHLIVADNASKRFNRPAAQIVKVKLRD